LKRGFSFAAAVLGLLAAGVPLVAHHASAAGNDTSKTVTIKGVITQVEWQNPHLEFYIDVKNQDGKVTNWHIDFPSPNVLTERGMTKQTLHAGDQVSVEIWAAKNGSPNGNGRLLTLPDGRSISGESRWDHILSTSSAR
jgi:Family of unknown function (DUF6152)